jgi:hypothetical protein
VGEEGVSELARWAEPPLAAWWVDVGGPLSAVGLGPVREPCTIAATVGAASISQMATLRKECALAARVLVCGCPLG